MADFLDDIRKEFERVVGDVAKRKSGRPVPEVLKAFADEGLHDDDGDLLDAAEAISRGDEPNIIWSTE